MRPRWFATSQLQLPHDSHGCWGELQRNLAGDDVESADLKLGKRATQFGSVVSDGDGAFFAGKQREIVVVPEDWNYVEAVFLVGQPQAHLKCQAGGGIFHANMRGAGG